MKLQKEESNGSRSMQIEYIKKKKKKKRRERNHRLGKVATHESMPYFH